MDEGVGTEFVGGADHQVTTGDEVVVHHKVSSGADFRQVFVGFTGEAEDIGAAFFDLAESLSGTGDSLVHDDGFHQRIVSEVHDGLDRGFEFFGEVVRVNGEFHNIFAIFSLDGFCTAAVVFRLGDGTGDDADMEIFRADGQHDRQADDNAQEHQNSFLHNKHLSLSF